MSALVTGNTIRFNLTATQNGAAWDLTGATVKLFLRKPDNVTVVTINATVDDAAGGLAHATTAATDLDVGGQWRRSWEISNGSIIAESPPTSFYVESGLA